MRVLTLVTPFGQTITMKMIVLMIAKQMGRNAAIHRNTGMHQIRIRFTIFGKSKRMGRVKDILPIPRKKENDENTNCTIFAFSNLRLQAFP